MAIEARAIRVLLVDDYAPIRQMLRDALQSLPGRDVEVIGEAADGEEGVRLASLLRPDLVIMDISLPGISGLEATRRIKQELPSVEVAVLTTHDDELYRRAARDAGALAYVTKLEPFSHLTSLIGRLKFQTARERRAPGPVRHGVRNQPGRRNGVSDFAER